jgi:hypothetical protein
LLDLDRPGGERIGGMNAQMDEIGVGQGRGSYSRSDGEWGKRRAVAGA